MRPSSVCIGVIEAHFLSTHGLCRILCSSWSDLHGFRNGRNISSYGIWEYLRLHQAGYETSANTLTYTIALLACRPVFQKALQADFDKILGNRPLNSWSFDIDFPHILNGYVGATMNETLRFYTVLPFFPKTTSEIQDISRATAVTTPFLPIL